MTESRKTAEGGAATVTAESKSLAAATLAALVTIGAGFFAGIACGGSEPEPETPNSALASSGSATYAAPSATMPPATATVASTAPTTSAAPSSPIAPIEPALAQAAQAVLDQVAKQEAPAGARATGLPKVGLLGMGQSMEMAITMQPGKCYTVIAIGLPPVVELNVQLMPATTIPGMTPVLGQDQDVGPRAIVGKKPNCFKWPLPMAGAANVVTTVATGTGLVGVQVYEQ